jgi:hypothetical protein
MRKIQVVLAAILLLAGSSAQAGRRTFDWDPVTPEDWVYPSPADSVPWKACILFERVTFDETGLMDEKVNISVYRRVRICSPEARSWGDVLVPYIREGQKVDKVRGRTVLKDGTVTTVSDEHIFKREVVQLNRRRIKQTAFSLPGLTDDCIIEYSYIIHLNSIMGVWGFQQEIPVRHGELHWKPCDFAKMGPYRILFAGNPNYVILNSEVECKVDKLPSETNCQEVVFTLDKIPPLPSEPHTIPEAARELQIQCYYGGMETAKKFWDDAVVIYQDAVNEICKDDEKVQRLAARFDTLATQEARIAAAYAWVQGELKNASYDPRVEESRSPQTLDGVIEEGQGSTRMLNFLFYDLLKKMHIEAHIALVSDREERLFVRDAKYWQFDDMVVAVREKGSQFRYYSPGDAGLCAGLLRWQNEGITTLLCDMVIDQFQATPFSRPEENRFERHVTVHVSENGGATGECTEQSWGLVARERKLLRFATDSAATVAERMEQLKEELSAREIGSVTLKSFDNIEFPTEATCSVSYAQPLVPAAGRWLVNPFEFMGKADNPFTAPTRTADIMFPYAYRKSEDVSVTFPPGWVPAEMPKDTIFQNEVGVCWIRYTWADSVLTVRRDFQLKRPLVEAAKYASVQRLFETRAQLSDREVMLGK